MNWRTNLYPEYKANRATMRRPVYYEEIGEYMDAIYPTTHGASTEADDLIAMRADSLRGNSEFVVVTIDKDMDQIEGLTSHRRGQHRQHQRYPQVGTCCSPGVAPTVSSG
jgi:hypothetical protein